MPQKIVKEEIFWQSADGKRTFRHLADCEKYESLMEGFQNEGIEFEAPSGALAYAHFINNYADLKALNDYYRTCKHRYFGVMAECKYVFPCWCVITCEDYEGNDYWRMDREYLELLEEERNNINECITLISNLKKA